MSGIFLKQVAVFNRAPVSLSVMFDGQSKTIEPGASTLPEICVMHARNQNAIFGSQDPNNPHVSGGRYLIVEEGEVGYGEPLTDDEWNDHLGQPSRYDEQVAFQQRYGGDVKAKLVVQGKGRKSTATSRMEAGGNPGGLATFSGKD